MIRLDSIETHTHTRSQAHRHLCLCERERMHCVMIFNARTHNGMGSSNTHHVNSKVHLLFSAQIPLQGRCVFELPAPALNIRLSEKSKWIYVREAHKITTTTSTAIDEIYRWRGIRRPFHFERNNFYETEFCFCFSFSFCIIRYTFTHFLCVSIVRRMRRSANLLLDRQRNDNCFCARSRWNLHFFSFYNFQLWRFGEEFLWLREVDE